MVARVCIAILALQLIPFALVWTGATFLNSAPSWLTFTPLFPVSLVLAPMLWIAAWVLATVTFRRHPTTRADFVIAVVCSAILLAEIIALIVGVLLPIDTGPAFNTL